MTATAQTEARTEWGVLYPDKWWTPAQDRSDALRIAEFTKGKAASRVVTTTAWEVES